MKYENKTFIYDRPMKWTFKFAIKRFLIIIYCFFIKLAMNIFYPPLDKKPKKYKVSICAIFKDEANYLKEWIEFHKIIGVQHFFLYNNFSSDNYMDVLDPYIKSGLVDLIEWAVPQGQMSAYRDCIEKYKNFSEWIGFIDIDEFVVPIKNTSIIDFLDKFYKNRPAVLIYWKMFGTSGKISRNPNSLVTEDFTICWDKHINIGKCFMNTRYTLFNKSSTFHHWFLTKYKLFKFPPVNLFNKVCFETYNPVKQNAQFPIQINHYLLKSLQEYYCKLTKGDVYFKLNPHNIDYFNHHEQKCGNCDYHVYKFLISLKGTLSGHDLSTLLEKQNLHDQNLIFK